MVRDPIPLLQKILRDFLQGRDRPVDIDGIVGRAVPWRPHILERRTLRGWYIHSAAPVSDSWAERIHIATRAKRSLRTGVAATAEILSEESFLDLCHQLNAAILPLIQKGDSYLVHESFPSVEDYVCRNRVKLSASAAGKMLDRGLQRALAATNSQKKGVLLELLVAAVLSQVDGFEVASIGIANRTQQMDVIVNNKNTGGALGSSPIVLAEAKNWSDPVGTNEYASFVRKLQSRHGRAKLGYLVTTGRFTAGVSSERRRDSNHHTLVVLIDGNSLPLLWRGARTISDNIEQLTIRATVGD